MTMRVGVVAKRSREHQCSLRYCGESMWANHSLDAGME